MGYFKNKEIGQQVEVGDRVPSPRPAATHAVHFPERRMRRLAEKRQHDRVLPWLVLMWATTMFIMGVTLGVLL